MRQRRLRGLAPTTPQSGGQGAAMARLARDGGPSTPGREAHHLGEVGRRTQSSRFCGRRGRRECPDA